MENKINVLEAVYDKLMDNPEHGFDLELVENQEIDYRKKTISFDYDDQKIILTQQEIVSEKETGTCDICKEETEIAITVLCEECNQSNQICNNCKRLDFVYCRNCDSVLDLE